MQTTAQLTPGAPLDLAYFGEANVVRLRKTPIETVVEARTISDSILITISINYALSRLA